jgi:hypothetical protein
MSVVKVKEYKRKGKVVRSHTRNWNDSKYGQKHLQFNVPPDSKSSDKKVVSKVVDNSTESAAHRAKALAEYKKRQKEMDDKENSPEEMKNKLEYLRKWRDGRRKFAKMKADKEAEIKAKEDAKNKPKEKQVKKEKEKKIKTKLGHKNVKELIKKVVETAAEKAKEISGLKE